MHATERERRKKGREKKVGKKVEPKPLLSFLFSHFPLVSCVPCLSPSHSLHTLLPLFSLSLTPQRNPVSPLGLELFEGDPELYCSLPLLPLLSSLPLPPSISLQPSTLLSHLSALRGPGSRSTKSSRAPNPGLGSALLPQASLAVPLRHRETRRWQAWEDKSKGAMRHEETREVCLVTFTFNISDREITREILQTPPRKSSF